MRELIEKIKLEAVEKQKKMREQSESIRLNCSRHPDSIQALEMAKLDEGTTMHFYAGRLEGIIETCDKILQSESTSDS